ncbi:MAG: acyl-CoA dehydrogenase, partial [Alphaproteobacteria bacterium]|nr:acyl-CoA dehydrogenase [Alphaproteobacteria bacterium]
MLDATSNIPGINQCREGLVAAEGVLEVARASVLKKVTNGEGKVAASLLEQEQFAAHGYAWLSTYVSGLREMLDWAERLQADGKFNELEQRMLAAAFAEYLNQIAGGIAISQGEVVRPLDLGLKSGDLAGLDTPAVADLRQAGWSAPARARVAELISEGDFGASGLGDETLD